MVYDFTTDCFRNTYTIILLLIFSILADQFAHHANKILYKTCSNTYYTAPTVGCLTHHEGRHREGEGRWEKKNPARSDKDRVYRMFSTFYCCPSWYGLLYSACCRPLFRFIFIFFFWIFIKLSSNGRLSSGFTNTYRKRNSRDYQWHSLARPVAVTTSRREANTQPGCRMAVRPNKLDKTLCNTGRSFRSIVPTTCAIFVCGRFVRE